MDRLKDLHVKRGGSLSLERMFASRVEGFKVILVTIVIQ
jgi:hypothetical protein